MAPDYIQDDKTESKAGLFSPQGFCAPMLLTNQSWFGS